MLPRGTHITVSFPVYLGKAVAEHTAESVGQQPTFAFNLRMAEDMVH